MSSFLNIGAIPKCATYVYFVLLIQNSFAIVESLNISLESLFVPRHDLYEKWLKVHLISASSAITFSDFNCFLIHLLVDCLFSVLEKGNA